MYTYVTRNSCNTKTYIKSSHSAVLKTRQNFLEFKVLVRVTLIIVWFSHNAVFPGTIIHTMRELAVLHHVCNAAHLFITSRSTAKYTLTKIYFHTTFTPMNNPQLVSFLYWVVGEIIVFYIDILRTKVDFAVFS